MVTPPSGDAGTGAAAAGAAAQRRRALSVGIVVVFVLLGTLVVAMDAREAQHILGHAKWGFVLPALLCTAISYLCLSGGYAAVNRLFGIQMPGRDLLEVGFVTFALNNLLSIGGTAGYSLRLVLLRRRGLAMGDVIGASLVHSYINHIVMMSILPVGLIYLLVNHPLGRRQTVPLVIASCLAILLLGVTTLLLVQRSRRVALARRLGILSRRVLRRDPEPTLHNLDAALSRGVDAIRSRPAGLALPILLVLADWATSVLALGFCFEALGERLHPGVLLTGFAIGISIGFLSMLPGGIGAQEGSMTGVYVLLGVDLERAVLASMLFRILYYMIPFVASLFLYTRILRQPGSPPNAQSS